MSLFRHNPVPLKYLPHLLVITPLRMMLALIVDVLDGRFNLRDPDGERSVTFLPLKELHLLFVMDPF